MIKVDVTASRELRAMIVGLSLLGSDFSKSFRKLARLKIEPEWKRALNAQRPNRLERHVLVETSRVSMTDKAIRLKAGSVGRLAKGDSNASIARAVEFGQSPSFRTRYRRRNESAAGTHTVVRRSAVPVAPRASNGKVVYPALKVFVPEAAAIAADEFANVVRKAIEG